MLAAIDAWTAAFVGGDTDAMVRCYEQSSDVRITHSMGELTSGIAAVRDHYRTAFSQVRFTQAGLEPDVVRRKGDAAWVVGRFRANTTSVDRSQSWTLEIYTTLVLSWSDGAWRIALEQSTPIAGVPRIREQGASR